jgi:hypothetical protein
VVAMQWLLNFVCIYTLETHCASEVRAVFGLYLTEGQRTTDYITAVREGRARICNAGPRSPHLGTMCIQDLVRRLLAQATWTFCWATSPRTWPSTLHCTATAPRTLALLCTALHCTNLPLTWPQYDSDASTPVVGDRCDLEG